MFRFVCKNILHRRDLFLFRYSSATLRFSTDSTNSFTVSYLIDSCQLSPEKAITTSKKVKLQTSAKHDSVLTLFRNYGFTNTHISQLVERFPALLLVAKPDTTLKPKLEFFQSIGFEGDDLPKLICASPYILRCSLEQQIKPSILFLRSIVKVNERFILMLKRTYLFFTQQQLKGYVEPNISLLRSIGVPESNIEALLVCHLRTVFRDVSNFKDLVEEVKKMGFHPSKSTFCQAVHSFSCMSNSTKQAKFDVYKAWGWSDEMIYKAIRMEPTYISLSERMIKIKMEFLVNKMGFDSLLIAKYPGVLKFNMEKRIIPRCSVIQSMVSSGFIERPSLQSIFGITDEKFLQKYVTKYEQELPQLLDVYQRKKET